MDRIEEDMKYREEGNTQSLSESSLQQNSNKEKNNPIESKDTPKKHSQILQKMEAINEMINDCLAVNTDSTLNSLTKILKDFTM